MDILALFGIQQGWRLISTRFLEVRVFASVGKETIVTKNSIVVAPALERPYESSIVQLAMRRFTGHTLQEEYSAGLAQKE